LRRKLSRAHLRKFMGEQPACIVAIEACTSAHHWGRAFSDPGDQVQFIPPAYVKPFVKRQKNDMADAQAIAKAASRRVTTARCPRRYATWRDRFWIRLQA